MKTAIQPTLMTLAILYLVFDGPNAEAVVPSPDGGYPGFNTAEGQKALLSLNTSTGVANTAVGWFSLKSTVDTSFNTAVGAGTLLFNTADQNTALGAAALLLNTTGFGNTAVGVTTLLNNTQGSFNTATGAFAIQSNTTGSYNVANGAYALINNTTGNYNVANGDNALYSNMTGSQNTAVGDIALSFNTGGEDNTAVGAISLLSNTTGYRNTAIGVRALYNNDTGFFNTAIGYQALFNNAGNGNTAIGYLAGQNLTIGDDNICIAADGVAGDAGVIRIGRDFSTAAYIAGISGQTASGGSAVFVNSDGKLGTNTSSARFKDEIIPIGDASEAILALKPVSFRYRKEIDPQGIPQFGLLAEEVEKVNPDLVIRDREGKPHTVRYEQINAMLLNEFLKEHKAFVEEQHKVRKLEATVANLMATVKEQAAQIQRVSAQLELNSAAPKLTPRNQ